MNARLKALEAQITQTAAEMDTLEAAAAIRGGDFTDTEQTAYDELLNRSAVLATQVQSATKGRMALMEAQIAIGQANGDVATLLDRNGAAPKEAPELTAGEFLSEYISALHPEGHRDFGRFLDRAARYPVIDASGKVLDRAALDRAQMATADTAGILPTPIVGSVVKLFDANRPAWNALTHPAMPIKGKTFSRPVITQMVTVAQQTEGNGLSSQKMTVAGETVTKVTYGGTLLMSLQDIEWTEPEALQLVVQDFADQYTAFVEGKACDAIEALPVAAHAASAGTGHSAWTTTNLGTKVASVINGIIKVYGKAKRMPDRLFVDLATWGDWAGTTNTNNDVTFLELLKKALADLPGMGGFQFVISPQFAADTRVIGCSSLIEGYEKQRGLLSAPKVSTLEAEIAYSGDVAFWAKHQGFVQLGADPG